MVDESLIQEARTHGGMTPSIVYRIMTHCHSPRKQSRFQSEFSLLNLEWRTLMKKRFTEEQIIAILGEAEAGTTGKEVCRRHGISENTFYRWKSKFGGMSVSDAKRLRALEAENAKLKKLLAESMLDAAALQELLAKNFCSPPRDVSRPDIYVSGSGSASAGCAGLSASVGRFCTMDCDGRTTGRSGTV